MHIQRFRNVRSFYIVPKKQLQCEIFKRYYLIFKCTPPPTTPIFRIQVCISFHLFYFLSTTLLSVCNFNFLVEPFRNWQVQWNPLIDKSNRGLTALLAEILREAAKKNYFLYGSAIKRGGVLKAALPLILKRGRQ